MLLAVGGADRGPLSGELQAGRHHPYAGPGAATGRWVAAAVGHGQGGHRAGRGAHQGLRGRHLLHHVQQDQGGQVLHTGTWCVREGEVTWYVIS